MVITVYCSGGIQKGNEKNKLLWTDNERNALALAAEPYKVLFFNPDDQVEKLDNMLANFGRDMYQIQVANFVVVDARQRRGIGIGTEMVAAKVFGTPLIAVVPRNSHYRPEKLQYRGSVVENYIHPHIGALVDVIVDDFSTAGSFIKDFLNNPTKIKGTDSIIRAIEIYKEEMLPYDETTLEIIRMSGIMT